MNSLEIIEFKNNIVEYINSKPYPMEIKRMVVAGVLEDIEKVTLKEVQEQIKAREDAEAEQEVNDGVQQENVGC